jgi:hypothetical protein
MAPLPLRRILAFWWRTLFTKPDAPEGPALRETVLQVKLETVRFAECEPHKLPLAQCEVCWKDPA